MRLSGIIDETFDVNTFCEGLDGCVVIDLSEVKRITSYGVREWIRAVKEIDASYLGYINARPAMVTNFNLVDGFEGKGELISLWLPYECTECQQVTDRILDLRKDYEVVRTMEMPVVPCKSCGSETELEVDPDMYLSYVARAARPSPPHEAKAAIDGEDEPAIPFRLDKEVDGTVTALWMYGPLDKARRLKHVGEGLQGEMVAVLAGLTSMTEDGAAGLCAVAANPDTDVSFARVPITIVKQLVSSCKRGKVVSLLVPLRCKACGERVRTDLEKSALWATFQESELGERCARCGGSLKVDVSPTERTSLMTIPLSVASPAVRAYLKAHTSRAPAKNVAKQKRAPGGDRFGEYQVIRSLGAGGMGEVLLARKTGPEGFEKEVVIKRILEKYATDRPRLEMFLSEARIAARLNHPNIVQIFDLGQVGGEFFIAMEHVAGWDLRKIWRRATENGVLFPIELACWIIGEVCAALRAGEEHTSENGQLEPIVHRDVSPENVMVSRHGAVKLGDFGIAKIVDPMSLTKPGTVKGKLGYMGPERLFGPSRPVDGRVDLYAASVILHEILTGRRLFAREDEGATVRAMMRYEVPRISQLRDDAPRELDEILVKALAKDPDQRFQSAAELRHELDHLMLRFGRPASSAQLAAWLQDLFKGSQDSMDLSSVTPSSTVATGLAVDVTAPARVPRTADASRSREDE
jgi:eukaryotic-like serine/threonine-protein kinase